MIFRKFGLKKSKNPIIFVPGIFGSLGDCIIPGTGDLDFGLAEFAYRPIINILKEMGYEEDKNLFIAYYDWTKSNLDSARNYLIPTIEKAKKATHSHKVDIISHSMGGIVSRAYAQSRFYKNDIDKLVMIATPNAGSVNAYYFWSGGEFPYESLENNVLYRLIKKGYLWYFKLKHKEKINMDLVRDRFTSVQELLPSYDYGNYLISNENEASKYTPIQEMSIKNEFLNSLNKNKEILKRRRIKTYVIVGTNVETTKEIQVKPHEKNSQLWSDGEPTKNIKTSLGDGTVTCDSVTSLGTRTIFIDSNHTEILADSKYALSTILQCPIPKAHDISMCKDYDLMYSILAKDIKSIKIDGREFIIDSKESLKTDEIIVNKLFKDTYWIMIKSKQIKTDLEVVSTSDNAEIVIYTGEIGSGNIKSEALKVNGVLNMSI